MNLSPLAMAKQIAESQRGGGGNASYLSIKAGESTVLRFLTAGDPAVVVQCSCGANLVDISEDAWETTIAAGGAYPCPQCGNPIDESNVLYRKNGVVGARLHQFMPCPSSPEGNKSSFVCLASPENAAFGLIPVNADGSAKYSCPVCSCSANLNKNGQPKVASFRLYGVAVEREVQQEFQTINGIRTPVTVGTKDVMVVDEETGQEVPKIVIVNMGFKGFWSKLFAMPSDSICYYDWRVSRNGTGLDTTYDVIAVNAESPNAFDNRPYMDKMPDITGMVSAMGSPAYYAKKGYVVPGYIPPVETGAAPQQPAQSAQQGFSTRANFQQPQQAQQAQQAQYAGFGQNPAPQQPGENQNWSAVSPQVR